MTGFLIATGIWWGAWVGAVVYLHRHRWQFWRDEEDTDLLVIDAAERPAYRAGPIEWSEDVTGGKCWRGLQPGDHVYVGDRLVFVADDPQARMVAG